MTKRLVGLETVRIWREEIGLAEPDNSDLTQKAAELHSRSINGRHLAEELLKLDRVNAVEVLDAAENGWVIYRLEDDGSF